MLTTPCFVHWLVLTDVQHDVFTSDILDVMQWRWGNIDAMLGGLAALIIAIVTLRQIPGGVKDWRARQRDQAALAVAQS